MRRRNVILIGVIVLLLVVGVGAFSLWQQSNAAFAAAAVPRQTGALGRGELSASVSGTGNINAPKQQNLSFGVSNVPVVKVNVKLGDQVKQGTVLAEAASTELNEQLQTAQGNLASARAQLDDLKAPPTAQELTIAELQVSSAEASHEAAVAALADLQAPPGAAELTGARAQLASAQAAYETESAKSNMSGEQITVARASLEKARIALEAAQAAYNAIAWQDSAPNSSAAQTLQTATIDYESALASYNLTMTEMNDGALKSAEATLAQARQSLEELTLGPGAQELASAQSSIESALQTLMQAKSSLDDLKAGAAQTDLLSAEASVASAKASVEQAKRALETAKIIAPFDGTVAAIETFVGQTAASGTTAITLVNTQDLEIEVSLSEVDVAQVKSGQRVDLSFDALSGKNFPGQVVAVSPLGTSSSGVVNYMVTIALTKPDPAILPGMTAQASIISEQRNDALYAPNRAVRTQGNRRIMTLLFEGREIPVMIQSGLQNDQYTEIVSATMTDGQPIQLEEGDTVLLNTTTTNSQNQRGFGGAFPGGGFAVPIR